MKRSKLLDPDINAGYKVLNGLRGRLEELSENFNKEIGNIKIKISNK